MNNKNIMKRPLLVLTVAFACCIAAAAPEDGKKFHVTGTVCYTDGSPAEGVVMSDGYSVAVTAPDGTYSLDCDPRTNYISYSIPSGCEVPLRQGHPVFYRKFFSHVKRYDFCLKRSRKGAEETFRLFLMADPQAQNEHHLRRFASESVPDFKAYSEGRYPVYGVTLGDIAYTENMKNTNFILPMMYNEMSEEKTGFPVFSTVGNHDYCFGPIETGEFSPTFTLARNRIYESIFGPVDYSWNRGEAHIISMNDVQFTEKDLPGRYKGGFTDDQLKWLEADLSHVDRDKLIVFCTHIPMAHVLKNDDPESARKVLDLLGQFSNCIIASGHTHRSTRTVFDNGIREYVSGAVSGCWWWSRNCSDGTPNGYLCLTVKGNRIVDLKYKGVGFSDRHQMRLYRGDSVFGGEYEEFRLPYGHNAILANIWGYEPGWTLKVYENGKFTEQLGKPLPLSGDYVVEPNTSKDWWAIGYHIGVVGRGRGSSNRKSYCPTNSHMFLYEMKDPEAKVKIVAEDLFGNRFTCGEVIEGADYSTAEPPVYEASPVWQDR